MKRASVVSLTVVAMLITPPLLAQDAANGKKLYDEQCAICHATTDKNGVGPGLKGVYGRKPAATPGFRYSRGIKNITAAWSDQTLGVYLNDPQQQVPGGTMPFSGIVDVRQRADIILYLKTLK